LIFSDQQFFKGFPRSVFFISYFLIFIFQRRVSFRQENYLNLLKKENGMEKEKTLIVGAGDAGEQILRSIISANSFYLPVGFADDNTAKQGVAIHGLRVLGKIIDIPKIVEENQLKD